MERKYNQGVADANRKRVKHGAQVGARQGKSNPTYKLWSAIKDRCFNPDSKHYHRYGGRGITMCAEWAEDYAVFASAIGERPKGATLDRIDNNGSYEPNNVRWASRKEQANNRETNVVLEHDGKTMTLAEWAEHLGWKYGLLGSRWKKGLRGAELFVDPKRERNKVVEFKGQLKTLAKWAEDTGVPYSTLVWRFTHGRNLF